MREVPAPPGRGDAPGPLDVLERWRRAVAEPEAAGFAALLAADAVFEFPFAAPGAPRRLDGREAIVGWIRGAAGARPFRFEAQRLLAVYETRDPEVLVAELELCGTIRGTGRPFAFPSIGVIRVRDGRIVSYRDYYNPRAVPEALEASGAR